MENKEMVEHVDLDGNPAGFDFKMSDEMALKKIVKAMLPQANRAQRRSKVRQFRKILRGKE